MQEVNYILHLNAVFKLFQEDGRLNPTHISLYLALFQLWNHHRFRGSFHVNREDVMKLSKIGSKSTYHKCLRELHNYKYLIYEPSHNPFKGSKIKMLKFSSREGGNLLESDKQIDSNPTVPYSRQVVGQVVDLGVPNQGQALVPSNKHIQTNKNSFKLTKPKNENEVLEFFKKEKWPEMEAQKFYNHYQSIGWKIGGKIKIENWHASAKNWMLKADEIKQEKQVSHLRDNSNIPPLGEPKGANNLHTTRNKNYNQPL
ncbi:hypothetical protein NMS_2104 [Nonlabens marinus S1-08]|uniref:Uncharacterized protein n=2 Tax=Nonlabens TaxID=363408 RepID=W8VW87_9FLAO|nr:hypothetical protein NMS_2104 [Nonlabens marinus S1-08]